MLTCATQSILSLAGSLCLNSCSLQCSELLPTLITTVLESGNTNQLPALRYFSKFWFQPINTVYWTSTTYCLLGPWLYWIISVLFAQAHPNGDNQTSLLVLLQLKSHQNLLSNLIRPYFAIWIHTCPPPLGQKAGRNPTVVTNPAVCHDKVGITDPSSQQQRIIVASSENFRMMHGSGGMLPQAILIRTFYYRHHYNRMVEN